MLVINLHALNHFHALSSNVMHVPLCSWGGPQSGNKANNEHLATPQLARLVLIESDDNKIQVISLFITHTQRVRALVCVPLRVAVCVPICACVCLR